MKTELEREDIQAIADEIIKRIKPLLSNNSNGDDVVFDVEGLSKYLSISKSFIYERTHLKEIPHYKVKGLLRFSKKDIDKWLNSHNVPAVSSPERILKAIK